MTSDQCCIPTVCCYCCAGVHGTELRQAIEEALRELSVNPMQRGTNAAANKAGRTAKDSLGSNTNMQQRGA